jgi:hypothetical protein
MEWAQSLSKQQLIEILNEFAEDHPEIQDIQSKIRQKAGEETEVSKQEFFINAGKDFIFPTKGVYFYASKAKEWLKNYTNYILANQVIILKAISEAVCDSILLNKIRPRGDLYELFYFIF